MMFQYGFELEGFATSDNIVVIPPKEWPVDGFPGLVEIRTRGGADLYAAYAEILKEIISIRRSLYNLDFQTTEHKFLGKELAEMRRTRVFDKDFLDVKNVYGKEPKNLNGKTLASFQINVSDVYSPGYETKIEGKTVSYPTRYRQLDVNNIVKRLDKEFSYEIKESKRQPGMYALKDEGRLEYRSLPNSVAEFNLTKIPAFLQRIRTAVEGV